MQTALTGARLPSPGGDLASATVVIEDGRIVEVGEGPPPSGAETVDLSGLTLAPGFIDMHVHGGGGLSLATRDPDDLRSYARWAVSRGVTSFLASIVAATPEDAEPCLRAVAEAAGPVEGGATLLGAHLEGPFVSPQRRGALPESWLHAPDPALFDRLAEAAGGHLRVMTLAPELPAAGELIARALRAGVIVAVGHSDATFEEAARAFDGGASLLTHAFNAMRPFHHREPGPLGAALSDASVTLELIADGVHVHPAAARMVLLAAGPERVALVSDAVPPAGLPDGAFRLAGREARLAGGRVTYDDGTIAGSAATLDASVRNVVDWGAVSPAEAFAMAAANPARVLGLERVGRIAPGYEADLVALGPDGAVRAVWVGGRRLFPAE